MPGKQGPVYGDSPARTARLAQPIGVNHQRKAGLLYKKGVGSLRGFIERCPFARLLVCADTKSGRYFVLDQGTVAWCTALLLRCRESDTQLQVERRDADWRSKREIQNS